MAHSVSTPIYSQIALDIALRIARGELKENTKIYGRSIMASEYGVSPETIRRALKLLEDMKIVAVRQNSGATVLSVALAREYVNRFAERNNIRAHQKELRQLLLQQADLGRRIGNVASSIVRINEKFSQTSPFPNYEALVPPDCPLKGQTLGELNFWQQTGATIIAIRREGGIILSPGPYAALQEKDTLLFVGDVHAADAVETLLHKGTINA